jgi:hypothetical protein
MEVPVSSQPAMPASKLPFPLQQNEAVLALIRRHWFFLWPRTVLWVLFAIVPPLVVAILMSLADAYDTGNIGTKIFWIIAAIWLIYWAVRILLNWYRYRHDIWVITNQRIVDCFRANPFSQRISTADLVNIQDMTVERRGIFATLFGFGDVVCETASESGDFVLGGIPHPADVQLMVDRERDRERMRGR